MSRVCELTGKRANNGMAVSHSHVRTKKLQQVRTIQKLGLGRYARELGVDLRRF
jgi:large subunit ribosomal protein L28